MDLKPAGSNVVNCGPNRFPGNIRGHSAAGVMLVYRRAFTGKKKSIRLSLAYSQRSACRCTTGSRPNPAVHGNFVQDQNRTLGLIP